MSIKNKHAAELVDLRKQANDFLKTNYSLMLDIPLVVNNRLRSTIGSLVLQKEEPELIELSGMLMKYGSEAFKLDVLKHELIHYALNTLGKPYHDGHPYFENELKKHGVGSSGEGFLGEMLKFECPKCSEIGYTENKRAMKNPSGFKTVCCGGDLIGISIVIFDGEKIIDERLLEDEK